MLNFWCAGCSTGEEPYSLAMVLAEYFGTTRNFSIFATDLCTQALRTARQAVYPERAGQIHSVHPAAEIYADGPRSQAGRFRIVPELRERVTFDYVNLIAPDWQSPGRDERRVLPQRDDLFRSQDTQPDRRAISAGISRPTATCSSAIPKP